MESTNGRKTRPRMTLVSIVGTRPQFVKLAPVCRAIEVFNSGSETLRIEHRIIHTGQHYDHEVAELLFVQMGIPEPDCNLAIGSASHGTQLARMLARLERVLIRGHVDWVINYGDTNSALAGALVAARLHLPLAHVEAGCRSADIRMPEEQTRIVADHLSRLLLAPSESALENLKREGIGGGDDPLKRRTVVVGDLMYDALLQSLPLAEESGERYLQEYELESGGYYLLTLHRAENTNDPKRLAATLGAAGTLDLPVLFPVHPRTKNVLAEAGLSLNGNLRPVPPVGYLQMLTLEKNARKILTDSGGVQKEAFYLGVPCVTLRDTTEWPETVRLGANDVIGTDPERIHDAAMRYSGGGPWAEAPYGNGKAAERIVSELLGA